MRAKVLRQAIDNATLQIVFGIPRMGVSFGRETEDAIFIG